MIGQVAPLTGTIAGTGNDYVAGGAAYFVWVNDNGGIDGRKIRVTLKDDSDKPDQPLAPAVALTRPAQKSCASSKNEQPRRRRFQGELLAGKPRRFEVCRGRRDRARRKAAQVARRTSRISYSIASR